MTREQGDAGCDSQRAQVAFFAGKRAVSAQPVSAGTNRGE